jgi:hypothetical protein
MRVAATFGPLIRGARVGIYAALIEIEATQPVHSSGRNAAGWTGTGMAENESDPGALTDGGQPHSPAEGAQHRRLDEIKHG